MSAAFKALDRALDPAGPRRLLRDVSAAAGWKIERVLRIVPVHLRPGRRMVVRYEIQGRRPREASGVHRLYGKLYRGHGGARARAAFELLAPRLPAVVRLAEVLGYDERRRFLLLAELEGTLLSDLLRTEMARPRLAGLGVALAAFHQATVGARGAGPGGLRTHDAAAEALVLEQARVRAEAAAWPAGTKQHFSACWAEVVQALCAWAGALPDVRAAVVHRDLYPRQVLARAAGDFGLLDLDEASWGDPEIDAGNLGAHLYLEDLQRMGAVSIAPELAAAFLDAYSQARLLDGERLRVYLAGSLLRLAALERTGRAALSVLDWPSLAASLVTVAEAALGENGPRAGRAG